MNQANIQAAPDNVVTMLRRLLPTRKLRLFEHQVIAEQQAIKLHEVLNQTAQNQLNTQIAEARVIARPQDRQRIGPGVASASATPHSR